jgi:phosphocarrier protein
LYKGWGGNLEMQIGKDILEKLICEIEVEIKNADGLHMRPAMQFVDITNQFDSDVTVSNDETEVDGKSIMQMSMLAATCGSKLKIKAEGPDAQEVINTLRELVEDKHFDEPLPKKKPK